MTTTYDPGSDPVVDKRAEIKRMIAGYQLKDSRLFQALTLLADQLGDLTLVVSPIQKITTLREVAASIMVPPSELQYVIHSSFIRLTWVPPTISGIFGYEVRRGTNWDSADFVVRTTSTFADLIPFIGLSETYMVKTVNESGDLSSESVSVVVNIVPPGQVTIDAKVIDNNILLKWTDSVGSFAVDYYEIKTGSTVIGRVKGNFATYFEVISGTYPYSITPYDIAGNAGVENTVELAIAQPPDYVLQDDRISALTGTRTNALLLDGPRLLVNWASETYENHFVSRGWASPSAQVAAGFPIFIQPAALTGSYEEVIDFGVTLANVIATIRYNTLAITPSDPITTIVKMAVSTDGISYSAFSTAPSQFIPSVRYLKYRFEFTGANTKALMEVSNINILVTVKRENDGGEITAVSTDATGTVVNFHKAFKDVESITATVKSAGGVFTAIIDFVDVPNPTSFKIYVYDGAGARATKTVEWKARGVV